ncbi:MAG: sugar kinase [Woeseiaceae bacterium]|nr:sugar kinase [Woeseiaceae bacterium]
MSDIAIIGECMLELARDRSRPRGQRSVPMMLRYGGDTLNTAVYLARAGISVCYATALGDDIYSDWLLSEWQSEGVDCTFVLRAPRRVPGLYMITTSESGERSFHYWRGESQARELFSASSPDDEYLARLGAHSMIYLTGITLSLYDDAGRARLFGFLADYKGKGGRIAFDINYRPAGWQHRDTAREAIDRAYTLSDIALASHEDEVALYGDDDVDAIVARIRQQGVSEIVVKAGGKWCWLFDGDHCERVELGELQDPVDTTAAGDSFNAGYLAARLRGESAAGALQSGHALASRVVMHPGAILPREE